MGVVVNISKSFEIALYNGNDQEVEYQVFHHPAITVLTKRPDNQIFEYFPPFTQHVASVDFCCKSIRVPAHSNYTLPVRINLSEKIPGEYGPVYQGKIEFVGSNMETVAAAYNGVYSSSYKTWSELQQPELVYNAIQNAKLAINNSSNNNVTVQNGYDSLIYLPSLFGTTEVISLLVQEHFNPQDFELTNIEHTPNVVGLIDNFPISRSPRSTNGEFVLFDIQAAASSFNSSLYRLFVAALPALSSGGMSMESLHDWQTYLSVPFSLRARSEGSTGPERSAGFSGSAYSVQSTGSTRNTSKVVESSVLLDSSIFNNVEVSSLNSNSTSKVNPYDSIMVKISVQSAKGLPVGASVNLELPEKLTSFPEPFLVYNDIGIAVGRININDQTNVLTFTVIEEWSVIYVTGEISFSCFLASPEQYTANQPVPLTFRKEDVGESSIVMIYIELADSFFPSVRSVVNNSEGLINVFIPRSFRNWTSLQLIVASDYGFIADEIVARRSSHTSVEYGQSWEEVGHEMLDKPMVVQKIQNYVAVGLSNLGSESSSVQDFWISFPVALGTSKVVNSPVVAALNCTHSGAPFSYYMASVLNTVSLKPNSMSLTGKRV